MRRLMSHLAHFSSISKQGELLCTQGLAYFFKNADARSAFADYISTQMGWTVGTDLTWRAEVRQQDGGRCDLEASAEGRQLVKVEGKLGALLVEGQLRSYVADLQKCSDTGLLLVLVPRRRAREIISSVSKEFALAGDGPWRLGDAYGCSIAVIYWEQVLDALSNVCSEPFISDLAQFQAMYRVLSGYDIEPITSDIELLSWREKEGDYLNLVDQVTRRLAQEGQILPMGSDRLARTDSESDRDNYQRRYVGRPLGTEQPYFSVGVRDPFAGHKTPIWLRFHRKTPKFSVICDRILSSRLSQGLIESGGHIWIPLDVPFNVDGEAQVELVGAAS